MRQTALHFATQEEYMDIIKYLVEVVQVDLHQTDEVSHREEVLGKLFFYLYSDGS
jgi:hypothetical protein